MDELLEDFTRKMDRLWVLDMLRDRHGLSVFECMGKPAEEIERRRAAYLAERAVLEEKWAKEDEEAKKCAK